MANTEEFNDDAELTGLISEPTDVDPVSGNEIPLGATAEGVRDDQTAAISPGEFVIPDYAVRYHGLDFYVESLQKAKQGLEQMESMGLVGNPDDQTMPDETPLPTMANEEAEMLDTGKPSESMPMDSGEMLDTGEPAEQEFQTGGLATTPLPQTPQQQVVPTTPLPQPPAIQPIRPVSTQPVPPLQVPTTPLGLDTSQYQQGYYIEASPGLYQLKGPPGISTTTGLVPLDQLNPQFKVAPPGTKYEDVFGGVSRGSLQKTGAGLQQPQQSLYESLQGEAAGQPGGYKIESFINDDGNIIYLTTVGGNVQGGLPPGYRKVSSEDLGLPSTTPTTPTELAQKPVIPPHLGGMGPGDVSPTGGVSPPDFRDVTEVMGYAPIGWSLAEIAKVGIASLMPGGTFIAGKMISKKQDEQKEQIKEQLELQNKTTKELPRGFFMTNKELEGLEPSLAQPGQAVGDVLSVGGSHATGGGDQHFSIGYGKGKVDPSLAAAVAKEGKGTISSGPRAGPMPSSIPTTTGDLSGLPSSIDLGPDQNAGNISGIGDDASFFEGRAKGGLVTKKMRQKKGSKGLASV